jgi:hypothetical protein
MLLNVLQLSCIVLYSSRSSKFQNIRCQNMNFQSELMGWYNSAETKRTCRKYQIQIFKTFDSEFIELHRANTFLDKCKNGQVQISRDVVDCTLLVRRTFKFSTSVPRSRSLSRSGQPPAPPPNPHTPPPMINDLFPREC